MIFEYFGCLGTSPGGLGHHFEPKARIFVILVIFPPESLVPFGLLFWYFLDAFFSHFLVPFWKPLFVKYGAKSIQNGRHLEVILRSFLVTGDFLIFDTPIARNPIFWGREGTQNASFLVTFLRVLSGRPLEHDCWRFWAILGSLWEPKRLQKGIKKWDPKNDGKRERG